MGIICAKALKMRKMTVLRSPTIMAKSRGEHIMFNENKYSELGRAVKDR